jgi:hypothetical protein
VRGCISGMVVVVMPWLNAITAPSLPCSAPREAAGRPSIRLGGSQPSGARDAFPRKTCVRLTYS